MPLILLDQGAPRGLRTTLAAHDVRTALQMGWDELTNGDLIEAAENAGFDVFVTADRNIRHQQNLSGRRLALVVLQINHWPTVRNNLAAVLSAVERATIGNYTAVEFNRPTLRRRPFPP